MIFRIACETYDKVWYVKANSEERAVEMTKNYTENLGWHNDYEDSEIEWEAELCFQKSEELISWEDM